MRTEPLTITGLAGPVVLESGFLSSKYNITVGGQSATRSGKRSYTLPAAGGGTVEGTVRANFVNAWPTLEINGVKHATGPPAPMALRVLAFVPLLLVAVGGAIGALIGALAAAVNLAITRQTRPAAVKALMMIGVLAAAVLLWAAVAVLLGR